MRSTASTSPGIQPPRSTASMEPPHSWPSTAPLGQPEPDFDDGSDTELLSVSWNQNYGRFAVGTSNGFQIYNCDTFKEAFRSDSTGGGFHIVEMLFQCGVLALVGRCADTQYPPNKVMIWDDHQKGCIAELTFRSNVRGVRLRRDRIVVVLEHKIHVHNFTDLKLLHQLETLSNPKGLCCISHHSNTSVLTCPGLRRGDVRIENFGLKVTKFISAHDSQIACMALSLDGLLLATASTKGTLIRIFNTMDGTRLQEVRRGLDRADVYSIALSPNVQWLVVSSDKGTIHVFNLLVKVAGEDASIQFVATQGTGVECQKSTHVGSLTSTKTGINANSSLYFMRGVLPKYFSSERSFSQFHLPEDTCYVAAFGAQNTVMIVGINGSFYRCTFDPVNGGEMVQKEYIQFLKSARHRPTASAT